MFINAPEICLAKNVVSHQPRNTMLNTFKLFWKQLFIWFDLKSDASLNDRLINSMRKLGSILSKNIRNVNARYFWSCSHSVMANIINDIMSTFEPVSNEDSETSYSLQIATSAAIYSIPVVTFENWYAVILTLDTVLIIIQPTGLMETLFKSIIEVIFKF